jgi:hypothetical protein
MNRSVVRGIVWGLAALAVVPPPVLHAADDADGVRFFEAKIRPVLVAECYACHSDSAKALKGGLRLDTREGLRAGGDSGPVVTPGKPDESPMLDALRHDGLAMPPRAKLPDAVVADFERWIRIGAPDPRTGPPARTAARTGIDVEAGRRFWAYVAPRCFAPPAVADVSWPRNDIDRFVLATLEARGLRPSADADRVTLIRRVSFDLVGLPPTPEEVDAFVNDPAPDAYERLVDRLLASPRFGERWARHWLDVVRFGESLTLRGMVLKEAWRYRDYVIEALNADRPFDRFVREQIAGDLLPAGSLADRRRQRVATTFLVLGNTNLEEQDKAQLRMDVVDEQLDTIGKAFLGQTLGCARCHDHKFDPIPTRDYYAMAGILRNTRVLEHANVSKWLEFPLPDTPEREAAVRDHEQEVAALARRIERLRGTSGRAKRGALAAAEVPGVVVDDAGARKVGSWASSTFTGTYIGAGYAHDENTEKGAKTVTFQPELPESGVYEVRLAYSPGSGRASAVPVTVMSAEGEVSLTVDQRAEPSVEGRFVTLGRFRFEKDGQSYVIVSNEGTKGHVTADAVVFLPAALADKPTVDDTGADATLERLQAELKRLRAAGPKRDMVMSVEEEPRIEDARVHARGSVHTLGEVVPRGFLRVATVGEASALPSQQSGRRELGDWIASASHPLTARVFVNRVWQWLFGEGIVRTPDNFGSTGERPTHPELLDDLALRFVEEGWSVKSLVRTIVNSRTYRLASSGSPGEQAADPENRLLSRANRRRMDAECLRDTMLAVSGRLRPEMGGPSFPPDLAADYGFQAVDECRSVYAPVFRNALPEIFEAFDFADPSLIVGRRNVSTVAPQSLFLLNHPFVLRQARAAATRVLSGPDTGDPARVERVYRLALGRRPTEAERRVALGFVAAQPDRAEAWALLVQALFASIDFRYLN